MSSPKPDTILTQQINLAWEHFKFHAEQRIRMFHFFILAIGLLLSAFSLLLRSEDAKYVEYAFVLLCIGGVLSTFFFTLDVRNTQLLEQSEALLQRIEEQSLYADSTVWRSEIDGGDIRLGILSREALLKKHIKQNHPNRNRFLFRWLLFDNIKHKISIRSIEAIAMVCFWIGAYEMAPSAMQAPLALLFGPDVNVTFLCIAGLIISLLWAIYAMFTPWWHRRLEQEALKAEDERPL